MRTKRKVNNFINIDSEHGPFILNRHCAYQAEHMVKTGQTHIEEELNNIIELSKLLPQECIIVDAGANAGLVTIPLASAVLEKKGVVHAFEPQRMMAYALCGSVALNDLENVHVYNQALGADCTERPFQSPDYSQTQDFGLFSLDDQPHDSASRVHQVTIDSLRLPSLDFLKIDVEGMEIDVLNGAQESLAKHHPWCWIEYWKQDIPRIKEVFSELNYDFYTMDKLNMLAVPHKRAFKTNLTINAKRV